jgi:hypothetical protein
MNKGIRMIALTLGFGAIVACSDDGDGLTGGGDGCDPSYTTVCIAPPPPDLNCDDIPFTNFPVGGGDPHDFDADDDGIGCEQGENA